MKAAENAGKIRTILEAGEGYADLYRTILAGPSGQRADLRVGRVRYLGYGPDEFEAVDMGGPNPIQAGFARRDPDGPTGHKWSIIAMDADGSLRWLGWASSLAVGVDVLVNGEHAALGRHNSRRISGGSITRDRTGQHQQA